MARINFDDPSDPVVASFGVPEECFYCQKPLAGHGVLWHATGQSIAFHDDCVPRFAARILLDMEETP